MEHSTLDPNIAKWQTIPFLVDDSTQYVLAINTTSNTPVALLYQFDQATGAYGATCTINGSASTNAFGTAGSAHGGFHYLQMNDVMWLVSPAALFELRRTAATTFTLEYYQFEVPPTGPEYPAEGTVTVPGGTYEADITFPGGGPSVSTWFGAAAGDLITVQPVMATAALPWSSNVIYTADVDFVVSDGCLYLAKSTGTSGALPPTHTYGTASDGGVSWRFCMREVAVVRLAANTGTVSVNAYTPSSVVGLNKFPLYKPAVGEPSLTFRAFVAPPVRGARAICLYQDRVCIGGSVDEPGAVWMSETGLYRSFKRVDRGGAVVDSNGVKGTLGADAGTKINFLHPGAEALLIGSNTGLWTLGSGDNSALSPGNTRARLTSSRAAERIQPVRAGADLIYVARGALSLRVARFDFNAFSYQSTDISAPNQRMIVAPITGLAYMENPVPRLLVTMNSSTVAVATYAPEQDTVAWHRWVYADARHSVGAVCVVRSKAESLPGSSIAMAKRDVAVFWIRLAMATPGAYHDVLQTYDDEPAGIVRTLPDATTRTDYPYVDGYRLYSGASVSTIDQSAQYDVLSETQAVANGANARAPDGTTDIVLSDAVSTAFIGYTYGSYVEGLPDRHGGQDGTSRAKKQKINELSLRVQDIQDLQIGTVANPRVHAFEPDSADPMDSAPTPFTGIIGLKPFDVGIDTEQQVRFETDSVYPATVLALYPRMYTADG